MSPTIKSRRDDISTQISHVTPSGFKILFSLFCYNHDIPTGLGRKIKGETQRFASPKSCVCTIAKSCIFTSISMVKIDQYTVEHLVYKTLSPAYAVWFQSLITIVVCTRTGKVLSEVVIRQIFNLSL